MHLFLHNLGVLNSNLPDDILYFVSITFKLTKKMHLYILVQLAIQLERWIAGTVF